MLLSVITMNLNWEILTRIQLLLKDGMGLKMENLNIMQVHGKGGQSQKNKIKGGIIETGGLGQFANLREEAWQKKGNGLYVDYQLSPGWVFLPSIL